MNQSTETLVLGKSSDLRADVSWRAGPEGSPIGRLAFASDLPAGSIAGGTLSKETRFWLLGRPMESLAEERGKQK